MALGHVVNSNSQFGNKYGIIDISGKCPSAMQILYNPMI
jgi:hypothetical protein